MRDGPPNISRSSVIGCVAKYELTKKRCHEGMFCSEMEVFLPRKGSYMLYNMRFTVETRDSSIETGKIL